MESYTQEEALKSLQKSYAIKLKEKHEVAWRQVHGARCLTRAVCVYKISKDLRLVNSMERVSVNRERWSAHQGVPVPQSRRLERSGRELREVAPAEGSKLVKVAAG